MEQETHAATRPPQGEQHDSSLSYARLSELNNFRLGRFCRALGQLASDFRESERETHRAAYLSVESEYPHPWCGAALAAVSTAHKLFFDQLEAVDDRISGTLAEIMYLIGQDPALYHDSDTSVTFRNGEPIILCKILSASPDVETEDRHTIEHMFGFGEYMQTEAGLNLARHHVDGALHGRSMPAEAMPNKWQTFGSLPLAVFEPFVRSAPQEA